jgi:3-oxoacyl-[acyl-carrier protein] reductase
MNLNFKDKHVLVTGAGHGIGLAIADAFLNEGAKVYCHYNKTRPSLECHVIQGDFSTQKGIEDFWTDFIKVSGGKLDILVNNAADIGDGTHFQDTSLDSWFRSFSINTLAPMYFAQRSLEIMLSKKSGTILNISSIGVKFGGSSKTVAYSASKAALEGLTRSLNKIGAPHGIRTNAIRCGVIPTALHEKIGTDLILRSKQIPMDRVGSPEEVAKVACFLCSNAASYISGAIIPVSGGE